MQDNNQSVDWRYILSVILDWGLTIVKVPFIMLWYLLRFLHSILSLLMLICVLGVFIAIAVYGKVLPMYQEASAQAYEKLSNMKESNFHMLSNTVIYDKDGNKIGEIDAGDYMYTDITEVSEWVQKGYIATEDKRFMEHCGIDIQSLSRAALSLIRHNGEITQGGSTITQQVIKNNMLTQEQTYSRKLVEVLLAPKIEQRFSKDKIMEFYVNSCYYGNLCYGIETASRYYFGKPSKELTLAEAAMLCGVSNSPNNYNPVASMDLAKQKMRQVLDNLEKCGYITPEQHKKALKQKIKLKIAEDDDASNDNYMVSYAIHCTAVELMRKDSFEFRYLFEDKKDEEAYQEKYSQLYKEKSGLVRSGGFKIYTSFNQKIQKKLQKSIDNGLKGYRERQKNKKFALQGASVCIDNNTGFVVAMVGGRGSKDEYNRAFLSVRQPGSTIKPLLDYAPAINEGAVYPSTVITDKPVEVNGYSPKNSGGGYRGDMKVREALARSVNTVAFQLYQRTGAEESLAYLDKLCFTSMSFADNSAYAVALGGFTNGCRVVEMAKGYATLAMDGQYTSRTCLTKVEHELDGEVYNSGTLASTSKQVYSSDTAFIMTDMMQGTIEEGYGTGRSVKDSRAIFAGKTGTTSSNRDAWFCGYSKDFTTSVWVGYDTPKEMSGMYGGTVPAGIWKDFMLKLPKNLEKTDFEKPDTISLRKFSSGKYTGDEKKVKDGKRLYTQRRGSLEWYSDNNESKAKTAQIDWALRESLAEAREAVKNFKSFVIYSIDDAMKVADKYAECLAVIDKVTDEYKQKNLKEQAAEHYQDLTLEVKEKWDKYIDEYKKNQKELAEKERQKAIDDSMNLAVENLKQTRINKAEWYITTLQGRSYMTSAVQALIEDGTEAVKRCKGYSEYSDLKSRWDNAVSRAKGLPEPPSEPDIPEDNEDDIPIDEDYYDDEDVSGEEMTE